MRYDLANTEELQAAADYLAEVGARGKVVDIKVVREARTTNQNSFLHVLLGGLGNYLGYTLPEMKTIYKRDICPELYVYDNHGSKFLRSSADLSVEAMSASIDKLRTWAEEAGYPLPSESDINWIRQLTNELEKVNYHI